MALDALEALLTRRSTRHYEPDMVEDDKLQKILEAARQAPGGGNSQTNHFLVIRSREVLLKLTEMTEKAFSRMEITDGMYPSLRHAVTASKEGGYVWKGEKAHMVVFWKFLTVKDEETQEEKGRA